MCIGVNTAIIFFIYIIDHIKHRNKNEHALISYQNVLAFESGSLREDVV